MILLFWFVNTVSNIDCFSNIKPVLYSRVKTHLAVLAVGWLVGDGSTCLQSSAVGPEFCMQWRLLHSSQQWKSKSGSCMTWSFTSASSGWSRRVPRPAQMEGCELDPPPSRWEGPAASLRGWVNKGKILCLGYSLLWFTATSVAYTQILSFCSVLTNA